MSDDTQKHVWESLMEDLALEVKKSGPAKFRMELSFSHSTAATLAVFSTITGKSIGEVIDVAVHCLAAMTEAEREQISARWTRVMVGTDDELRRFVGEFEKVESEDA